MHMHHRIRKGALLALLITLFALGTLACILSAQHQHVHAQSERNIQDGITLLAVDGLIRDERDIDTMEMSASFIISLLESGIVSIGEYTDSPSEPRTYQNLKDAEAQIASMAQNLRENEAQEDRKSAIISMLARYGSYLGQLGAGNNSRLVLLTSGRFNDPANTTPESVAVFVQYFISIGLQIDVVSLPTTPALDREVLARIAQETGGKYFDLGFKAGIANFFATELGIEFSAQEAAPTSPGQPFKRSIEVPPHSDILVAGIVFDDPKRQSALISPNGQELVSSDQNVKVTSSSSAKIYLIDDPEAGNWSMTSAGEDEEILFLSYFYNPITLQMKPTPPFPTSSDVVLQVNARAGDLPHIDDQATVEAIVTLADGTQEIFKLNDAGRDGDERAEDGAFSALMPTRDQLGMRSVTFNMRWPQVDATVQGSGMFSIDPFPEATVKLQEYSGPASERALIAEIELLVGGYPYLAAPDDLQISVLNRADDTPVEWVIEPAFLQDDKSYQFTLLADIQQDGNYDISVSLATKYLERDYVFQAPPVTAPIELSVPIAVNYNTPILIAVGAAIALILAVAIFLWMRPKPFGYIYKVSVGKHELVADMSRFRFAMLEKLFNGNVIPAAALRALPLRGGRFVFRRGNKVEFVYRPEVDGAIRMTINGNPIAQGATLLLHGAELRIAAEDYVFLNEEATGDVRLSPIMELENAAAQREEMARFTQDPLTFDAPSSARPTRRF